MFDFSTIMNAWTGEEFKPYEDQYLENLQFILEHGIREPNARTGVETLRVPATCIVVNVGKEFPILTSKQVAFKTLADELCWMHVHNDVNTVRLRVPKIWEKTKYEDETIGKTYGYQSGKKRNLKFLNQLDYVIQTLKRDPSSRHALIDLWDPEDLDEMALPPCLITYDFTIINGKLNLVILQRSSDYPLGVPFDTTQAAILMHIVARELGVELGVLVHYLADSHIYANQIEGIKKYLEDAKTCRYPAPTLKIADRPWYSLIGTDFELENYQHGPKYNFELN